MNFLYDNKKEGDRLEQWAIEFFYDDYHDDFRKVTLIKPIFDEKIKSKKEVRILKQAVLNFWDELGRNPDLIAYFEDSSHGFERKIRAIKKIDNTLYIETYDPFELFGSEYLQNFEDYGQFIPPGFEVSSAQGIIGAIITALVSLFFWDAAKEKERREEKDEREKEKHEWEREDRERERREHEEKD